MPEADPRRTYLAELQRYLGEGRVVHSLNVATAARQLAQRFAPQLAESAELAGMLHDNAKRLTEAELIASARRFDIEVSSVEAAWPALLHGKVGAALLPERFGVHDREVAAAVADHVTGRPNMGLLSRILYVADQVAADREFEGVEQLRQVARTDLGQAVFLVSRFKLQYALLRGRLIEPMTVAVYNEFRSSGS